MKIKLLLLLVALVILNGLPATHAQTGITEVVRTTHKGRIKVYHLNAEEKKTCMQMVPELPQHKWACILSRASLYRQIDRLLLEGYSPENMPPLVQRYHWWRFLGYPGYSV